MIYDGAVGIYCDFKRTYYFNRLFYIVFITREYFKRFTIYAIIVI